MPSYIADVEIKASFENQELSKAVSFEALHASPTTRVSAEYQTDSSCTSWSLPIAIKKTEVLPFVTNCICLVTAIRETDMLPNAAVSY